MKMSFVWSKKLWWGHLCGQIGALVGQWSCWDGFGCFLLFLAATRLFPPKPTMNPFNLGKKKKNMSLFPAKMLLGVVV